MTVPIRTVLGTALCASVLLAPPVPASGAPFVASADIFERNLTTTTVGMCGKGRVEGTTAGTWILRLVTVRTDGTHVHDTRVHFGTTFAETCIAIPADGRYGSYVGTVEFTTVLAAPQRDPHGARVTRDLLGGCTAVGLLLPYPQGLVGVCPEATP